MSALHARWQGRSRVQCRPVRGGSGVRQAIRVLSALESLPHCAPSPSRPPCCPAALPLTLARPAPYPQTGRRTPAAHEHAGPLGAPHDSAWASWCGPPPAGVPHLPPHGRGVRGPPPLPLWRGQARGGARGHSENRAAPRLPPALRHQPALLPVQDPRPGGERAPGAGQHRPRREALLGGLWGLPAAARPARQEAAHRGRPGRGPVQAQPPGCTARRLRGGDGRQGLARGGGGAAGGGAVAATSAARRRTLLPCLR